MSSAFAGLFSQKGSKQTNSLFSNTSKFKRHETTTQLDAPPEPAEEQKPAAPKPRLAEKQKSVKPVETKKRKAKEPADKPSKSVPAVGAKKPNKKTEKPPKPKKQASNDDDDEEHEDEDANLSKEEAALRLQRTIFVGNLPAKSTQKSLKKLFSAKFGPVESVRLRSVAVKQDTKLSRKAAVTSGNTETTRAPPHAYIVFQDLATAQKALEMNMKVIDDRHLIVNSAVAPFKEHYEKTSGDKIDSSSIKNTKAAAPNLHGIVGEVRYDPMLSVFCGNVHLETQEEELIQFFLTGLGPQFKKCPIQAVRIVRDPDTHLGKGIAYVLFTDKAARKAALGLDGQQVRGRALRITSVRTGVPGSGGGGGKKKKAAWQMTKAAPSKNTNTKTSAVGKSGSFKGGKGGRDIGSSKGGSASKSKSGAGKKGGGVEKIIGKRKSTGKRPAVMARKIAQQQKKQKS